MMNASIQPAATHELQSAYIAGARRQERREDAQPGDEMDRGVAREMLGATEQADKDCQSAFALV